MARRQLPQAMAALEWFPDAGGKKNCLKPKENRPFLAVLSPPLLLGGNYSILGIFTELAPRPIQTISCNVRLLCVPSVVNRNCIDWRLLVKKCIAKIPKLRIPFFGMLVQLFFLKNFKFFGLCFWQTSLWCIVGELSARGLVAVAVGKGYRCQVPGEKLFFLFFFFQ